MDAALQTKLADLKTAALKAAREKDAIIGPLTGGMLSDTCEKCMREVAFDIARSPITREGLNEKTLEVIGKFLAEALPEIEQSRQMGWMYLGTKLEFILENILNPHRVVSDHEKTKLGAVHRLGIQARIFDSQRGNSLE